MPDLLDEIFEKNTRETDAVAARSVISQKRNPALVARARKLADKYGISSPLVEAQPEVYEMQEQKDQAESVFAQHPWISAALAADPEAGGLFGKDDLPKIGSISSALGMTGTATADPFALPDYTRMFPDISRTPAPKAPPAIRRVGWSAGDYDRAAVGVLGTAIGNTAHAGTGIIRNALDVIGLGEETEEYFARDKANYEKRLAALMPADLIQTEGQKAVFGGLSSVVQMLMPLAVLSKGKLLNTLALETYGLAYSKYREKDAGKLASMGGAAAEGLIEKYTEMLPVGYLTKGKLLNGTVGEFFTRFVLGEAGGEQLATAGQAAVEQLVAPDPGKTWQDYWNERPAEAMNTLIATGTMLGSVGAFGVVAGSLRKAAGVAQETMNAVEGQAILNEVMKNAESVDMRKTAPEEFAKLINQGAAAHEVPLRNVYIPIETVEAVLADETIPEEEKAAFTLYQDQIEEARAIAGSEIVIPIGDAAAYFSGTKMWKLLQEDARGEGYISIREARENLPRIKEEIDAAGTKAIEAARALGPQLAAKAEVFEEVKKQLIAAGRSPKEATANAQLWASRAENLASARYGKFKDAKAAWDWMKLQIQGPSAEQAKGGRRVAQADERTVINIGLNVNDGSTITPEEAVAALKEIGVEVTAQEIRESNTEPTLIAALDRDLTPEQYTALSAVLRQDAVAVRTGDVGALYGPQAEAWGPFNPEFFLDFTPETVQQTDVKSEAFKRWFGDSKVVDENGDPLVVYHGTPHAEFEVFDASFRGAVNNDADSEMAWFFTSDRRIAEGYGDPEWEGGGRVIDAYLSLQNPRIATQGLEYTPERWAAEIQAAKAAGNDGVIFPNANDAAGLPPADVFAVFNPTQIKSVDNVGTFNPTDPRIFNQSDLTPLEYPASAAGALELAKTKKFATIRDYKLAVQAMVKAASTGNLRSRKRLIRLALADARQALALAKNAIGWYNEKMQQALEVLGELHPEIKTDPDAKFAFIYALAVTSQGLKVSANFKLADRVYREFKKTGQMPLMGEGTSGQVMKNALQMFNVLTERMGVSGLREFMLAEHTVGEIEKTLGVTVTGEGKGTVVKGAAFLGPKIGNGYFSNLYGDFSQLTMDRWFIRTWGRWTGTLVNVDKAAVRKHTTALKTVVKGLTAAQRKQLEGIVSGKRTPFKVSMANIEELGKKISQASMSADVRRQLAEMHPRLRLDAQALTKAIDGQKEAPQSASERNEIRSIFNVVLTELQNDNPELTMADLQAVLWYPEKRLYDTAKEASGGAVQLDMFGEEKTEQESLLGYDNDDAPDYANAAVGLARSEGVAQEKINAALQRATARVEATQRARRAERGAGERLAASTVPEDENGFPLEDVLVSAGDGTNDPMVLQQFGGEFAATSDVRLLTALSKAIDMENTDADPDEIWRRTGWGRGDDGAWRFEIDDSAAYMNNEEPSRLVPEEDAVPGIDYLYSEPRMHHYADDGTSYLIIGEKLGDLLVHPELFRLYPELANTPVFKMPLANIREEGLFDGVNLIVNSNTPIQTQLSTMLHEIQHAIQNLEGFAGGASPGEEYLRDLGLGDVFDQYLEYYQSVNRGEIPNWRFPEPRTEAELRYSAAYAVYERVAGEVEARNTQARQNLLPVERREKAPWITADFERKDVLLPVRQEERIAAASTAPPEQPRPARGEARFYPDGRTIIQLFKADFSTMLHEMSHVFLEQEFRLAKEKGASAELKADVARLEKWFADHGHPVKGGKIPVEAHELFARTGERYFREGKAPSAELRSAFKQFKEWLTGVYKSVKDLLAYGPAPINPEIRDIMDRMLATSEAIEANAMAPMSQEELGMTTAEYAAYLDSVNESKDRAHDKLLERMMKAIRRREEKAGRARRADIRAEVEEEVNAEPGFIALHLLRTGRWLGQPERERVDIKINTGWLIDNYGEEVLTSLPVGLRPLHRGDGVPGDVVAEMVGLPSGDALVKTLLEMKRQADALKADGNPRPLRDQIIEDRTDELMNERYGDIGMSDAEIEEEAIAAINSNRQGEVLATELRQLKKQKAQGVVTPYQLLREWARRKVNEGTVADAVSKQALQRYVRGFNKARTAFEEALLGGKAEEAIKQKQAQMINHALLAEGKKVADEINSIVRRMQRYAKTKAMASIDQDYMDRIHELLEGYNFRNVSDTARAEQASFEEWAEQQRALGHEVHVPPRFRDNRTNWKDAQVAKLLELNDMVQSLAAQGKLKRRLTVAGQQRALEEMRDEAEASILALPERDLGGTSTGETPVPLRQAWREAKTFGDYRRALFRLLAPGKRTRQAAAGLVKIEGVADILDGTKLGTGVLNRVLIQGATDAVNKFTQLTEEVMDPITKIYRGMSGKLAARLNDHVTISELTLNAGLAADDPRVGQPITITRKQLLGLVANTGNLSNLSKLVGGERWGDPESATDLARVQQTLISYLNKEEMDLVQAMWDGISKLWPHIVEVERELTGIVPEQVTPMEIKAFGQIYSGGYWPVVWDGQRTDVGKPSDEHAESNLFGVGRNLGTPKGHTIARTGAAAPMDWSLEGVLFGHTTKVISRIAYAPWVRDSLKLLNAPRVSGAIRLRMGNEYLGAIKAWMRDQIPSNMVDVQGARFWENILNQTRINFTIGVLGVSYSTGVAQMLGLGYSAGVLGEGSVKDGGKWMSMGFAKMIQLQLPGQPGAQEFVFSRSEEMRRRATELNREVIDVFRNLKSEKTGRVKKGLSYIQAKAFWHIAFIDLNAVSIPTWLAGYEKGKAQGLSEEEAAALGDKSVRLSQGSGREKDMAAIQRGTAGQRFIAMFYTPSSVFFNQQWEAAQHMKAGNWSKALVPTFWFLLVTTLLDAMREGDWPEDEDDDGQWLDNLPGWVGRNLLFGAFYGVPILRDITNTAERKIRGEYATWGQTPLTSVVEGMARGASSAAKLASEDEEFEAKDVRNSMMAVGFTLGIPASQPGKTGGFLWDVYNGNAEPDSLHDWFTGLTTGKLPEEDEE